MDTVDSGNARLRPKIVVLTGAALAAAGNVGLDLLGMSVGGPSRQVGTIVKGAETFR